VSVSAEDYEVLYADAFRAIVLLVAQAGGEVIVTRKTMVELPTHHVLARFYHPDGSIHYRLATE